MIELVDHEYLTDLVKKARRGDSNAFAELFTAGSDRLFSYCGFLQEEDREAAELYEEVCAAALVQIRDLHSPELYLPWLLRLALHKNSELHPEEDIFRKEIPTPAGRIEIAALNTLPLTESAVTILRFGQHLSLRDIALLLNFSPGRVKQYLRLSLKHLRQGFKLKNELLKGEKHFPERKIVYRRPGVLQEMKALEDAFSAAARKPNTVPLEALRSYTVYRKERFSLQRSILVGAMILFALLPVMFVLPVYEVRSDAVGERGLPVYTVEVHSLLPVRRIRAALRKHALPVYEADAKVYTVEPIRNGEMTIKVELINAQESSLTCEVTEVDANAPLLRDNRIESDKVFLYVADEGIGVDYPEVYALDRQGNVIRPLSFAAEKGEIVFAYPQSDWDIYIPDHIGNTLHLSLSFRRNAG